MRPSRWIQLRACGRTGTRGTEEHATTTRRRSASGWPAPGARTARSPGSPSTTKAKRAGERPPPARPPMDARSPTRHRVPGRASFPPAQATNLGIASMLIDAPDVIQRHSISTHDARFDVESILLAVVRFVRHRRRCVDAPPRAPSNPGAPRGNARRFFGKYAAREPWPCCRRCRASGQSRWRAFLAGEG